jgi:ribosomal-protein-alanine N-acetyltransferase
MTTTASRIKLRNKRLSDAKDDFAWQTDRELAELDAALVLSMNYQQFFSEYTFELCYPNASRHEFAIESNTGEHIGNCVYYNVDNHERKAEIGIMIGKREYWNQGYGREAINLLLEHIFSRTRLEKLYLNTLDWNIRAQKCFANCGFQQSGQVFRDGSNFYLMVLRREDWEKQKRP